MQPKNVHGALVPQREPRIGRYLKQGEFPHITRQEYLQLLAAAGDLQFRFLLEVLWTTGARISEVLALRAQDLVRRDGEYFLNLLRLKRRKHQRQLLPIPNELGLKLDDFVRLWDIRGGRLIFPISRWTVWRRLRKLGWEILGRDIFPSMFRHGRVYDLARRGIHPFLVAKVMGHVNIQTTLGYYHPDEDDIRGAMSD